MPMVFVFVWEWESVQEAIDVCTTLRDFLFFLFFFVPSASWRYPLSFSLCLVGDLGRKGAGWTTGRVPTDRQGVEKSRLVYCFWLLCLFFAHSRMMLLLLMTALPWIQSTLMRERVFSFAFLGIYTLWIRYLFRDASGFFLSSWLISLKVVCPFDRYVGRVAVGRINRPVIHGTRIVEQTQWCVYLADLPRSFCFFSIYSVRLVETELPAYSTDLPTELLRGVWVSWGPESVFLLLTVAF
jgi:hypothetical protein